jgi:predicted metalloendopeptidase
VELASRAWWQDASTVFLESDRQHLERARKLVTHITDDVKDALKAVFDTAKWEPSTRREAMQKLENMEFLIGWSDRKFRRPEETPDADTAFDEAIMLGFEYQFDLQWRNHGRPTDAKRWRWVPYGEVNAFYSRELNSLFLPASLFYPPYLNLAPDHTPENYAAMGSIIAHELFHGFDYDSKEVSAEGTLRQWWTPKDRKQFNANVKKTVKLYSEKRDISGDRKMDGRLTLSENIADLVSLRLAWNAFVNRWRYDHYADPSLEAVHRFFETFSLSQSQINRPQILKTVLKHDFHALAEARVNLPLSTFEPFLQAYDVRRGDPMLTPLARRPSFLPPQQ